MDLVALSRGEPQLKIGSRRDAVGSVEDLERRCAFEAWRAAERERDLDVDVNSRLQRERLRQTEVKYGRVGPLCFADLDDDDAIRAVGNRGQLDLRPPVPKYRCGRG